MYVTCRGSYMTSRYMIYLCSALCTLKPKKPLKKPLKKPKNLKKIPKNLGFFQPWTKLVKSANKVDYQPQCICAYTTPCIILTRAQLLPRMADRTRAVRLCLHPRCVEYLATGNFYLLA